MKARRRLFIDRLDFSSLSRQTGCVCRENTPLITSRILKKYPPTRLVACVGGCYDKHRSDVSVFLSPLSSKPPRPNGRGGSVVRIHLARSSVSPQQNRNAVSVLKGRAAERTRPRVYTGASDAELARTQGIRARIHKAGDFFEFRPVRIIRKKPVDQAAQRVLGSFPVRAQIRRTVAAVQKKFSNLLHICPCEDCFCRIHKNLHPLLAR